MTKIVFDFDDPMGDSTCVACGECVQACPTGALMPKPCVDENQRATAKDARREVDSVCPFCGVGCQITAQHQGRQESSPMSRASGRPGQREPAVRQGPLRLRLHPPPAPPDQAADPREPTRRQGPQRRPAQPAHPFPRSELGRGAGPPPGLCAICGRHGGKAVAGFGSAKCSNEEAYLFQKLIRTGLRPQQCRPLHAAVPRLVGGGADGNVGSGAVTATFNEIENADVIIVIGANPTENHPVAATFFKQFAKRGGRADRHGSARQAPEAHASHMLQFRPAPTCAAQRDDARDRRGEALRPAVHPGFTEGFEAAKEHLAASRPRRWSRSAASAEKSAPWRASTPRPRRR
jgi:formate dehydrogenase major subunit